jgi:hypothetical protein
MLGVPDHRVKILDPAADTSLSGWRRGSAYLQPMSASRDGIDNDRFVRAVHCDDVA